MTNTASQLQVGQLKSFAWSASAWQGGSGAWAVIIRPQTVGIREWEATWENGKSSLTDILHEGGKIGLRNQHEGSEGTWGEEFHMPIGGTED